MQVTANDMKAAGFRVSLQVSDTDVQRAIDDCIGAYLEKVCVVDDTDTDQRAAAMSLAFILLLRRSPVATRSGGKVKETPAQSSNTQPAQGDIDNADRLLRKVQTASGHPSKLVDDIAGIYYRNTMLSL